MLAYNRRLDGLRAVAVSLVLVAHWVPEGWLINATANGQTGVYLFFVLSGFLITSILLSFRGTVEAGRRSAWGGLGAFYARRSLRIFPLYYLALFLVWIVPDLTGTSIRSAWSWYAVFAQNSLMWSLGRTDGMLTHFWSLAVEEQFYLLWGAAVLFLPERVLARIALAATLAAPVIRWVGIGLFGFDKRALTLWCFQTPSCLDGLGLGALVALGKGGATVVDHELRTWSRRLVPLALAVECCYRALPGAWWLFGHHLAAWLSVAALYWALDGAPSRVRWLDRLLESKPVVAFGRRSYGLYLIHGFVPYFLVSVNSMAAKRDWSVPGLAALSTEPWQRVSWLALTIGFAFASWQWFEAPLNSLKDRYFSERKVVAE